MELMEEGMYMYIIVCNNRIWIIVLSSNKYNLLDTTTLIVFIVKIIATRQGVWG